jgi:hypothetical protein
VHKSEQQFAKLLLETSQELEAAAVVVARMDFTDVDLCTIDVSGMHAGWQPIIVELADTLAAGDRCEAQAPAAAPIAPAGPRPGVGDLLDLVLDGSASAAPKRRTKKASTSAHLRNSLLASLPVDPSLQEGLCREVSQLLADENVLLPELEAFGPDDVGLHRAVEDPAVAASLDAESRKSVLNAVSLCEEAHQCAEEAAEFSESDDGEIVGESVAEETHTEVGSGTSPDVPRSLSS